MNGYTTKTQRTQRNYTFRTNPWTSVPSMPPWLFYNSPPRIHPNRTQHHHHKPELNGYDRRKRRAYHRHTSRASMRYPKVSEWRRLGWLTEHHIMTVTQRRLWITPVLTIN